MEYEIERQTRMDIVVSLDGGWILLPLLAAAGGAWAFNRGLWSEDPATLGVLLALILGGWQPLWRALTRTGWATPLSRWPGWPTSDPLPRWPYVQPGTPGDRLLHRLALTKAWWRGVGQVSLAQPLRRAISALLVSLLLSLALGRISLLLTLVLLTLAELAALWHEGRGKVGPLWTGIALIAAPWFLGASLGTADIVTPALSSLVLALMIGLYAHPSGWALTGPVVGAAYLLWQGHESAVGWLLLLALPGLMALTSQPSREAYRRAIGPWVLCMVALMAWVL
ncbi:MAG: hypothetical protein MUQ30_10375 [Anaerolineae bacterium]|nr:hypothetical protein [Anaerolineae bacterium]